jgi:hypothetical protein
MLERAVDSEILIYIGIVVAGLAGLFGVAMLVAAFSARPSNRKSVQSGKKSSSYHTGKVPWPS